MQYHGAPMTAKGLQHNKANQDDGCAWQREMLLMEEGTLESLHCVHLSSATTTIATTTITTITIITTWHKLWWFHVGPRSSRQSGHGDCEVKFSLPPNKGPR